VAGLKGDGSSFEGIAVGLLDSLISGIRLVCRVGAWAGGILFFAAALLITVEVFVRKIFSVSTGASDELSGYGFAIATALALGFGLLERAHIRVDTFYLYLSPRWRAACDLFAAILLLWFFALLFRYGWGVVEDSWRVGARSRTGLYIPLVIPQLAWAIGLGLTVVVAVLLLLRAMLHLVLGELEKAAKLIGPRAMEEEVADELAILDEQRIREGGQQ
jgi:TRAP-type C4-dicarboxylate transport system permease small subunit